MNSDGMSVLNTAILTPVAREVVTDRRVEISVNRWVP